MQAQASSRASRVILFCFISFVGLGWPSSLLGLAWPSIRATFGLSQDAIGFWLIAGTIGYMTSSFVSSRVMFRLGSARAFLLGAIVLSVGLFAQSAAPIWPLLIVASLINGLGGGMIDAGMNNYVSSYYNARQMNWLHASYGLGWVLGSGVMTAVLSAALSWRVGYAVAGVVNLGLVVMFFLTSSMWRNGLPQQGSKEEVAHAPMGQTLRQPMLWLSLLLILVYVGIEASPTTWAYTIFTESRHMATDISGLAVTLALATFTLGRVFFGFVGERVPRHRLLRLCLIGAFIGALLLWWNPVTVVGIFGLLLLMFAQAPVFALLILGTSERVGARHTANAIGVQLSAAGAGFAVVPGLSGVLAQQRGLESLLPFFVVLAIAMYALNEAAIFGAARANATERVPAAADQVR
jgi:fucose permease